MASSDGGETWALEWTNTGADDLDGVSNSPVDNVSQLETGSSHLDDDGRVNME